ELSISFRTNRYLNRCFKHQSHFFNRATHLRMYIHGDKYRTQIRNVKFDQLYQKLPSLKHIEYYFHFLNYRESTANNLSQLFASSRLNKITIIPVQSNLSLDWLPAGLRELEIDNLIFFTNINVNALDVFTRLSQSLI